MTDTTAPSEGGGEYAGLLDVLGADGDEGVWFSHAAVTAIRALEAKVRERDEALSHAIWQAESDDQAITRLRADRDRLSEALAVEKRLSKSWQETAEKFRQERDRLAGEVERLRSTPAAMLMEKNDALTYEVARLTSELAAAREELRQMALRAHGHYMSDAEFDAARRAGEGEKS